MAAKFWLDVWGKQGSADGRPDVALKGLDGEIDGYARGTVWAFWNNDKLKDVQLKGRTALYMRGTTEELQIALNLDIHKGLQSLFVEKGKISVWYIRYKSKSNPVSESIVCVAGRGTGADSYWNMPEHQSPDDAGEPAHYWKEMIDLDRSGYDEAKHIPIRLLIRDVLPRGDGEAAWYPALPTRSWHWHNVERGLDTLLAANVDGDKHLRSDARHISLYVHDDQRHGIGSPKEKYAEGIKLMKSAIDLDYGPGRGERVFRSIDIKSDSDGLKLKNGEKLRRAVSEFTPLDAHLFRYEALPGPEPVLVGRTCTLIRTVNLFYVIIRTDRAVPTPDPADWYYTGDKVHISVDPEDVRKTWDITLPVLLQHCDTISEFKVTNMADAARERSNDPTAQRVYVGAQITILLHAAPGDEERSMHRFLRAIGLVHSQLRAQVRPGKQPAGDLAVSEYLSYRHDLDDLLDPGKADRMRKECARESDYISVMHISERKDTYLAHSKLMERRPLYRELKRAISQSS